MAFMADGYLNVVWAPDNDQGEEGIDVWDVSDPRSPRLVRRWNNADTQGVPQQHGFGLWNRDGQIVLAVHLRAGMRFYDVTSIGTRLALLGEVALPSQDNSYFGVRWVSAQAPYFFAVARGNGLYVVDATDPTA